MTNAPSATTAIAAALAQNWKEAITINTAILKEEKTNIDALNRLGFAYLRSGQFLLAKRYFNKVLALDQYNQIALKNLHKLTTQKKKELGGKPTGDISPLMFLEEPGKTKIVVCVNPAPIKILAALSCGQELFLKVKKHCVELRDDHNTYLAALPDDLSFKLIKFIAGGNAYHVVVKSVGKNALTVFVRETERGKRFFNQPSFTTTTSYLPFSRPDNLDQTDKPNVTATGEDDEEERPENEESTE